MVNVVSKVERRQQLWNVINPKAVGGYIKTLRTTLKKLDIPFEAERLTGIEDRLKDIYSIIEDEIRICEFYFEFSRRKKREPNFNEWVFIKKNDRKDTSHWNADNDCWQKTNGKIFAIIEIVTRGKMTKLSLCLKNDSAKLTFYGRNQILETKHRKTANSISAQIEKFKAKAEELFKEYEFPQYCKEKGCFDLLKKLLHIEELM